MASSRVLLDTHYPTLSKFMFSQEGQHIQTMEKLNEVLDSLQIIAKVISAMLRRTGVAYLSVSDKDKEQKRLQVLSHEVFVNILSNSEAVALLVSDQSEGVIKVGTEKGCRYIVAFHCLDGASSADCSIISGSTFVILEKEDGSTPEVKDVVNPKNKIVASGYILYSSCTLFVFTTGQSVDEFVLDPQIGEFLLTQAQIMIPKQGHIYSINEGYEMLWDNAFRNFIKHKKVAKRKCNLRYVGSMVADLHRILKYGGLFMYPSDSEKPRGKLSVLYECKPMAFLVTVAGGLASDGDQSILNVQVSSIHETSPIFIGSKHDVQDVLMALKNGNSS